MEKRAITRRDFLKAVAASTLAGAFPFSLNGRPAAEIRAKSRVVLVRSMDAVDSSRNHNPEVIQKMLDEAVTVLVGVNNPLDAWKKLVAPSDVVGIENNVWKPISTGSALEQAIKQRVMDAEVFENNIDIRDRGVLGSDIFKKATAFINARPARTHHWSGMGTCIKNYIQFVPDPPSYHGNSCAHLAKIWFMPHVKGRTRLNILSMLTPLFHGIGPHHYSDEYAWNYRGLLVSQDPVAVDAVGLRILHEKRKEYFGEERPLQPPVTHITVADEEYNLGNSKPEMIELIKLGWNQGILI